MRARDSQICEADTFDATEDDVQPEVERTHYVPYFTVEGSVFRGRVARRLRAVCGEFVGREDSTVQPTCPDCQQFLTTDPYAGKTGEEVF